MHAFSSFAGCSGLKAHSGGGGGGGGGSLAVPDRNAGVPQFRPPPRPPVLKTVIRWAQSWIARVCARAGQGVATPLSAPPPLVSRQPQH